MIAPQLKIGDGWMVLAALTPEDLARLTTLERRGHLYEPTLSIAI